MTTGNVKTVVADLTVVGGGMAGICAAIAAARGGLRVALVHDRPVLGGNASSEIRVWICGATGGANNVYAREGGIVEELILENMHRNSGGSIAVWDGVLLDAIGAEPDIGLFLNTAADGVEMVRPGCIRAVTAFRAVSQEWFRFESPLFLDASGDGIVGAAAGAEFRRGREARAEHGESWAPEIADGVTLGASLLFAARDAGRPVRFRPPAFARDFRNHPPRIVAERTDPFTKGHGPCYWWWIEFGGDLDTIADAERIRDELRAAVYGVWDYIKNGGKFPNAANLDLEWVGSVPGKRESRRFLGDYILAEGDLVGQSDFPDAVAHGGWSIDLHPPKGIYDENAEGSRHWQLAGPYPIPFRCLYSRNVENLFLGGRLISMTHVAFGSVRVMMTLAALGQAAGAAAALCRRHGVLPRGVAARHAGELQQRLLRDDQWVMGVSNRDPEDLARRARVTAVSTDSLAQGAETVRRALDRDTWLHLPVAAPLERVQIRAEGPEGRAVKFELWRRDKPQNYLPSRQIRSGEVFLSGGWLDIPVGADPAEGPGILVCLKADPAVSLLGGKVSMTGVLAGVTHPSATCEPWGRVRWLGWLPAFRALPETGAPFAPANVVNGFSRPYGRPNVWRSRPIREGCPEWVELAWDSPVRIGSVQIVFNTGLDAKVQNTLPQEAEWMREVVRDYTLSLRANGAWRDMVRVTDNYRRLRRHGWEPVEAEALRITVEATGGAPCAEIFEVRACTEK
ncbi:MAG: FAD-dependent oxidoreductase [Planctomycetota bacterium]